MCFDFKIQIDKFIWGNFEGIYSHICQSHCFKLISNTHLWEIKDLQVTVKSSATVLF